MTMVSMFGVHSAATASVLNGMSAGVYMPYCA
jgi:hypothetical protein